MILSGDKKDLLKCLDIVHRVVPTKSSIPALQGIYVTLDNNKLTMMCSNLDIGIKTKTEQLQIHKNNTTILPMKFYDIIKHLPLSEFELSVDEKENIYNLNSGSVKFKINCFDPEEFPQFPSGDPIANPLSLSQFDLKKILRRSLFAVSQNESRPAFTGVLFSIEKSKLNIVSSDTFRLTVANLEIDPWEFDLNEVLIPAKNLNELYNILSNNNNNVDIFPSGNNMVFKFDDVLFYSRILDEKFPDIKSVIPNDYQTKIQIERSLLEDCINRASLISEGINNTVNFKINNNVLFIDACSEVGKIEEQVMIEKEGEELEISLNYRFILDILKVLDSENIIIYFNGSYGPCIIKPENDNTYRYLILPIKNK